MNKHSVVSLTNKVSIIAIFLLLYWVFIFAVSTIFGFKVFQENLTQSFFMAIMGILALLAGAVIVNIMFNMTIISQSFGKNNEETTVEKKTKKRPVLLWAFFLSFPLIALLLYAGDLRTSGQKERNLVKSARYLIENNSEDLQILAKYSFDSLYIEKATGLLKILSKQDENFPSLTVLVSDNIDNKKVLLQFGNWFSWDVNEQKTEYLFSCSPQERKYLQNSFKNRSEKHYFSAADGTYELYFPVNTRDGFMVLYFTDRQRYGKIGS